MRRLMEWGRKFVRMSWPIPLKKFHVLFVGAYSLPGFGGCAVAATTAGMYFCDGLSGPLLRSLKNSCGGIQPVTLLKSLVYRIKQWGSGARSTVLRSLHVGTGQKRTKVNGTIAELVQAPVCKTGDLGSYPSGAFGNGGEVCPFVASFA